MSMSELRNSVQISTPKPLKHIGKIYYYNGYLYINEVNFGIHVFDNTDPSNPVAKAFIVIPGNRDIAIKDGIIYADNHVDLVAIDISNPENIINSNRVEDVFPADRHGFGMSIDPKKGVVVDWNKKEVVGECDKYRGRSGWWEDEGVVVFSDALSQQSGTSGLGTKSGSETGGVGIGGSLARFAIYQNFLYAVTNRDMKLFDISTGNDPRFTNDIYIGRDIETIFPYKDKLFIGSQSGMYIYENSDPSNPTYLSEFEHAQNCDPVVVTDKYAYVTLRAGNPCQGTENELDIIDITDLTNPVLIAQYDMVNPYGLGIDGSTLFVCDGSNGLRTFSVNDPLNIEQMQHMKGKYCYDVIPFNDLLMLVALDGLHQYDYSDPSTLQLLSTIPVLK